VLKSFALHRDNAKGNSPKADLFRRSALCLGFGLDYRQILDEWDTFLFEDGDGSSLSSLSFIGHGVDLLNRPGLASSWRLDFLPATTGKGKP
jgi:hypothetical protein